MKTIVTTVALLLAILGLAGCKTLPGGDGQYATHDHGQSNRGSP